VERLAELVGAAPLHEHGPGRHGAGEARGLQLHQRHAAPAEGAAHAGGAHHDVGLAQ
jgi:hypothetical protein